MKKKVKLSAFEKFIFVITFLIVIFSPVMSIYSKSALAKANYEVEEKKDEIFLQAKSNQSLEMKINELASLENLSQVAKEKGLSYTSNSVKTIE